MPALPVLSQARPGEIRRLKRKYGKEVAELVSHLGELRMERDALAGALEEEMRVREELLREEGEAMRDASCARILYA